MAIHVSELDAARDFMALLAKVRNGEEVIIEAESAPIAVLRAAIWPKPRSLSECIALAKEHERATGTAPIMDDDFAQDVEEVLRLREPWHPPAWD